MAAIIVYFSRRGNNYVNGAIRNLAVGNTEVAALFIKERTGADAFKVEALVPYSEDYSECIEEARQDQKRAARPELKTYPPNLDAYTTVYLGFPNYWGTMPMLMFTFLEHYDFSGKIIKPFCTHEGSGMGRSEQDIQRICSGAKVEQGLPIHGANVQLAGDSISRWL